MAGLRQDGRKRIVVLEDDPDYRELIRESLAERYEVFVVPVGVAALDAVEKHSPQLVILDVHVPGLLHGLEVCRKLRASAASGRVSILVYSGRTDDWTARQSRLAGADDYLVKPSPVETLLDRVERLIGR